MADFISTYHGPEFEEGLRRIIINDPESLAWIDKGTMTYAAFNSFNELGNWRIRINPYSEGQPYPYDYNVVIFEKPVNGATKRFRVVFASRGDAKLLYDWNGTAWVANMHTGMGGPVTAIGSSLEPPAPGTYGNYDYVLVNAQTSGGPVMMYGKAADGRTWIPVMNEDVMRSSVYDPSNRKKPPLKYLDDVYIIPDTTTPIMLKTHIPDKVIHMSTAERNTWVAAITQAQLDSLITEMKQLAKTQHESVVQNAGMDATDLKITKATEAYQYHEQNRNPNGDGARTEKIHITQKERDYFNSKAPGDHRHEAANHRVQISTAKVVSGVFSVDRMPPETLLKIRIVASRDAMLHFTPASAVHIGDVFHVVPTSGNEEWYRVKDLTKLTTLDGYYDFTVKPEAITGDWNNIKDKPTTVAKLGTTDLYTKTEVDTRSAQASADGIKAAYHDPDGAFLPTRKTVGDATWLMHNYRYPQGYQGNGDVHPGNFADTNAARVPSLYRIIDRLYEMKYMKSRNTENFINQFTFFSTIWGRNDKGAAVQQLNPYQMYYPFVSEVKLRNPYFQTDSYYGHGVVISFERSTGAVWYTKVNDGVMHYLDLYALRYSAPKYQKTLDAVTTDMNDLIKKTTANSSFKEIGYVLNIAPIPAIASYNKSKTPYEFSGMDNGGIAVVFRSYTTLIPFNDTGILDPSGAMAVKHEINLPDGTFQGVIPQKRLDIEPIYADRYSDRSKYASHTSRYPIGFVIRYVLYSTKAGTPVQNGFYVHAARFTRPASNDGSSTDSHYVFEITDQKSSLNLKFNDVTSETILSTTTWTEVVSSSLYAMVYGGGSGPRVNGDWDTSNCSSYTGKLAIGSHISDSVTATRFLHRWNNDNRMQLDSYTTVSRTTGGSLPSFYDLPNTVALYDTRTIFRLDENKLKIAMYGKALMKCDWDTQKTHQSMELLMVQNVTSSTHPNIKNSMGGDFLSSNDIKKYNEEQNQFYIVPINQLINDYKCRKKNVAVSIPTPNYRISIDRTSDENPAFVVEAGKVLSWHILDASLSDIYYFDYVAGRYLMIVGTEYRSFYDLHWTLSMNDRRNSADRPLPESEIVFLESYDDCKSFQVVKVMPKFRPEDLLAARNEYPRSLADSNPVITPNVPLPDMNAWNVGINSKLAVVVQDEVAYIYNMQDSEQLPNPRIVSLNTFNDKAVDEIHETMSPFPYDASGEKWNPIIKDGTGYRQYLYYEDGFVHYRESKEGISWKIVKEEVTNAVSIFGVEGLIGRIDTFLMDSSIEREAYYKNIPSAENPPVASWIGWDKNGIPPVNPFGRDFHLQNGNGGYDMTTYNIRIHTKLSIYYVYDDADYRLLVMTAYEGVPVILGYNKSTKVWMPVINTAAAAVKRMKWGLRPGAIALITRHDAYIDKANNTRMTIFHLLSRDKMAGDFGPGLISAGGSKLTDPTVADSLVCGNYDGSTTSPSAIKNNVNALLPMRDGTQDSAPRQFTRFTINNRTTGSLDTFNALWNYGQYSIYGLADAMQPSQIHGYNHTNVLEVVKGSFGAVLQGFDFVLMQPNRYPNSINRDNSVENNSWRGVYGAAKKIEDWLIAQMTASGHTPPTTGRLGSIESMYAYSNDEYVTKEQNTLSTDHNKTYTFSMQYLPTAYLLFAVSGASAYGVSDGIYRMKFTMAESWLSVNLTSNGAGVNSIITLSSGLSTGYINSAKIEFVMKLPGIYYHRPLIKAKYIRSYSKQKTGVHSLVSLIPTDGATSPNNAILNYRDSYVIQARNSLESNDGIVPVKSVDEVLSGIGLDLDSYTDPASYKIQKTASGAGVTRMSRRLTTRASSYRARNTDQWHGIPPYQTGKPYKQAWSLNPEDRLYPYNTSYMQTITDPMGYTIFGTNQTVVAKSFLGMYAYLYRFNIAYKNQAITNIQQTEDLITEASSVLNDGMELFTN